VDDERVVLSSHRRVIPALALVLCLATVLVSGAVERGGTGSGPGFGATTTRLGSIQSNRYQYWRVAAGSFARHPLIGLGSGGFRVDWLRHRTVADPALNAHSLYIETAAELGIVGLVLLLGFLIGVARSAREALRPAPGFAVGAAAAVTAFAIHAGVDWDWQIPAVTIPALVLAGALIALADGEPAG
jgi:O-antigen ligase